MGTVSRSLREALRTLLRKPGVTVLAVSSLALAIGFSTAAFSVLDAYALRDLPVRNPGRLALIDAISREGRSEPMTWPEYETLVSRTRSFEGILSENLRGPTVKLPDRDDSPITAGVSDNFFDLLGIEARMGQVFRTGHGQDGTVVLSYRYWRDALKTDAGAVGRTLLVGGGSLRILGILPPDFAGTDRGTSVDLFVPMQGWFGSVGMARRGDTRFIDYDLLGYLRPGVTLAQARAECEGILRQMEKDGTAPAAGRKAAVSWIAEKDLAAKLKSNAVMLAVVVLLVLIAAANLTNLRLVANESRRHETGVRLALGASRVDLARGHLAETLLLSIAGTGLGTMIAAWLVRAAPAIFYAGDRFRDYHIRIDARSFAFSTAALVAVALIGALIPLADAWRRRILPVMQTSRLTGSSRWLAALVVTQMALVTGVTCSAGLLWRSLQNVSAIRPAMDPDRQMLLVAGTWNARPRVEETAAQLAQSSGVTGVAWARRAMLSGSLGGATVNLDLPGQPRQRFHFNEVSASYFGVTGARVLSGRGFAEADGPQSTLVVMLNQTAARRFFGEGNPLGQWLRVSGKDRQVIGVVEDGPADSLRERIDPYFYFPFAQRPDNEMTFFVATSRDPALLTTPVRDLLRGAARDFSFDEIRTLRHHMRLAHTAETRYVVIVGSLAALGLFLAAAGLFGVTMFAVARRTPEFGIRMAMGATPGRVAAQVLRQAAMRVAIALPLGWMVAWTGRQAIQKMLYGVASDDATVFIEASLVVAFVACAAALRPALRAARVDPMTALRHE
jgi:predicted permease